jgi:hypothetical protein
MRGWGGWKSRAHTLVGKEAVVNHQREVPYHSSTAKRNRSSAIFLPANGNFRAERLNTHWFIALEDDRRNR